MKLEFYIFALLCSLVFSKVDAQVNFSQKKHAYGDITSISQRWFDLQLKNKGTEEVKIIKVTNPDNEFEYKFSSMVIPANGSSDIRIQYNPLEKGKQKLDLTFFFDKESIDFEITANVLDISRSYTPCPDFDNPSPGSKTFETTIEVFDKVTRKPLSKANIRLISNLDPLNYITNRNGIVTANIPLSYYAMNISADGYSAKDSAGYINSRNDNFMFFLEPEKNVTDDEVEIVGVIEVEDQEELLEDQINEILLPTAEETTGMTPETNVEENEEFSRKDYAPNNIVFLMDVSTSMKKEDRLVMLKKSLMSLTDMMRSDDIISLITYASTTNVLIEGQPMNNKELIKEIISEIDGKGTTAGGKGIKKAYALASKYKIDGGNNHVYIATDGAFNKNDEKLTKTVSRQTCNGLKLSVISLNSSAFAKSKMVELSTAGQGDFVNIEEMDNISEILRSMIKKQSRIE